MSEAFSQRIRSNARRISNCPRERMPAPSACFWRETGLSCLNGKRVGLLMRGATASGAVSMGGCGFQHKLFLYATMLRMVAYLPQTPKPMPGLWCAQRGGCRAGHCFRSGPGGRWIVSEEFQNHRRALWGIAESGLRYAPNLRLFHRFGAEQSFAQTIARVFRPFRRWSVRAIDRVLAWLSGAGIRPGTRP